MDSSGSSSGSSGSSTTTTTPAGPNGYGAEEEERRRFHESLLQRRRLRDMRARLACDVDRAAGVAVALKCAYPRANVAAMVSATPKVYSRVLGLKHCF
ncbi:hypothetical protein FOA52_006109 [Chlamydomonas sp. UWO 241]|nr:hypothetical protein FOA52_006109 [Chlamydomonas sp. UWO 241]